jgi:excisionase family DNA binding protein
MDEQLMKPAEVADMLKISRAMAYKLLKCGEIPAVRIGTLVRVKRADLERYIHDKGDRTDSNLLPNAR